MKAGTRVWWLASDGTTKLYGVVESRPRRGKVNVRTDGTGFLAWVSVDRLNVLTED
jgi:hypothetical protein